MLAGIQLEENELGEAAGNGKDEAAATVAA
jgi:hypothetical protein